MTRGGGPSTLTEPRKRRVVAITSRHIHLDDPDNPGHLRVPRELDGKLFKSRESFDDLMLPAVACGDAL